MASALKCPNPSCPYLFDPTTVPPGVVLACPRCGMRFTLGPPSPQPPPAGATATFPASPGYPAAGYSPPAGPPAEATFGDMTPETARSDGEEGPRLPVRTSKFQTAVLVVVAAVALSAAGVAVWWKLSTRNEAPQSETAQAFKEYNLLFDPPPDPWVRDEDTRAKLGFPFLFVYKRNNPDAFIAFGAKDFATTQPRPSDLGGPLDRAVYKLLDRDAVKMYLGHEDIEPTWMGKEAQRRFKFTGVLKGEGGGAVEGQAVAVAYKGIGYWFLAWTGAADIYEEQKPAFAAARQRLRLLDLREGWAETQPSVIDFKGDTVPYAISDGEGIWKEVTNPDDRKGEDPKADKFLRASVKEKGQDFSRDAKLVIAVLDAQGPDPLEQGRAYVEGHVNGNIPLTGKTTFAEHAENTDYDPPTPVPGDTPYVLLKGTNEVSRRPRLWAISAVRVGDKTVVAYASCLFTEEERKEFERKFVVLVRSLRATG